MPPGDAKHARRLRHALDHQHARKHRIAGKVSHELRLVGRHIFDPDGEFVAAHGMHAIDHQERIPVRQRFQDLCDIGGFNDLSGCVHGISH